MKKYLFLTFILAAAFAANAQQPGPAIREVLQPYVDNGDIAGIVTMISDGDKVLDIQTFGYANLEKEQKIGTDNLFWIASQSKPICGVAVMMLVDDGVVDLDEPVTTYLPELNRLMVITLQREGWQVLEKVKGTVTLRNLMSHMSGMQDNSGISKVAGTVDVVPIKVAVYESALTPLVREPWEEYIYSNQDINIAAAVVEKMSGMPYEEFLQKRLFDPLGMKSTTFWPTDKQMETLTIPYGKKDAAGPLEPRTVTMLQYPYNDRVNRHPAAGTGLFCTPADLVKFYQMVANKGTYKGNRIMSEEAVKELTTKQTRDKNNTGYGVGWVTNDLFKGHAGAYGTDSKIYNNGLIVQYFVQSAGLPKEGEIFNAFETKIREIYNLK